MFTIFVGRSRVCGATILITGGRAMFWAGIVANDRNKFIHVDW